MNDKVGVGIEDGKPLHYAVINGKCYKENLQVLNPYAIILIFQDMKKLLKC